MKVTKPEFDPQVSRAELDKFHKSFGFQISSSLDEAKKYEALQLLYRHKAVFARDVSKIKQCKAQPLTLELHTDRKCFKRQFRLNDEDKAEVTRQIKEMEDVGVIEPSDTPYYNSPIFLVWKKNGKHRLVIDLRGINSLIVPKLVQLPQIEELLDTVTAKKPRFLSSIDVTAAFWQIKLDQSSRDLTSFTGTDGRHWRFTRCPFGLSNSPRLSIYAYQISFLTKHVFTVLPVMLMTF